MEEANLVFHDMFVMSISMIEYKIKGTYPISSCKTKMRIERNSYLVFYFKLGVENVP